MAALAALTGCPDDGGDVAPTIVSFDSTATNVDAGQTVTLSWTVDDAVTITLEAGGTTLVAAGGATDTYTSDPLDADTTFKLTASNGFGEATRSITVTVNGGTAAPTVDSFAANPTTIDEGNSSTLSWQTTNATAVDIMAGGTMVVTDGDADGSTMVTPATTTTYTLVAKGADSQTAMAMVTVTVNVPGAPTIATFSANPAAVDPGNSSTLSWNVMGATSIEISDGASSVYSGTDAMGTQAVTPAATTTYTLTATNDVGSVMDTVTVTVNPPMGASVQAFTANPSTVMLGASSDLSWMTTNANSVEIMAGGAVLNTSAMNSGTYTVTPTITTEYTLMARNPAGDAMAMTTVTVNASAPVINAFTAAPNPIAVDGTVTLSWDVLGADTVRVLDGTTELANTTMNVGTVGVTVTSTLTVYTLEVANVTGGNTSQVMVYGHNPASVVSFTATPTSFVGTTTVTLSWNAVNVQNLGITLNGAPLSGFTPIANPMMTTNETGTFDVVVSADATFVLSVDSLGGADSATVNVLQVIAETEPNDTPATAVVLTGAPIDGTIGFGGEDIDYFAVTVPAGGWVRIETSDGMGGCSLDTFVDLFDTDGVTPLLSDDNGGNGNCSLIDPAFDTVARNMAGGTYYVAVTGSGAGAYQLDVTSGPAACGNSLLETGESCDDGNTVPGDGCDATCAIEPVNVYTAPGAPATFAESIDPAGEQDFYRIVVTAPAIVTIETFVDATAGTCPSGTDTLIRLYDSNANQIGSDDDDGVGACSLITPANDAAAVMAPGTYYLRVEEFGNNGVIPSYEIVFSSIAGNVCGNGIVEPANGEICDDGNLSAGDGCDATCQPELLLDYTAPGPLATVTSSLTATQVDTIRITATSSVYIVAETLEDAVNGTCATIDTRLRLRDGTGVELGTDDLDGVGSCSLINPGDAFSRVGPGVYYLTIEEDGMNAAIAGYTVGVIGIPVDVCGNGVIEAAVNEQCDDGNTTGGDGCNATCQQEVVATYTAPGAPATITNAIAVVGEQDLYQITVTAETYVDVETFVDAAQGTCPFGNDTVIYLLDSTFTVLGSDDEGGVNSCSAFGPDTDGFTRLMPGTYYVLVEEYLNNGTIATYDIVFQSAPVDICGNGVLETGVGEACDDGNTTNGDGCSATCALEGNVFNEVEPNGSIGTANDPGLTAIGRVTAAGVVDLGQDQDFYVVTVPTGGADINIHTYTTLGDRTSCVSPTDTEVFLYDAAGTQLANNDDIGGGNFCSDLTVTGLAAGTYYISVEYYSRNFDPTSPFPYFVDLTLQ